MAVATNKLIPYGGVQNPIAKFIVNIIPNVIGLIPKFKTIGNKIGVNIIVPGILSINIPTIIKKIFIKIKITIPLSLSDVINVAIFRGICSIVNNAAKAVDSPTMNVVAPLTTIASLNDLYASLRFSSL